MPDYRRTPTGHCSSCGTSPPSGTAKIVLNQMLDDLPDGVAMALERLSVKDMRFKSRQMNRALRASQLSYVRDNLEFKLDECGIRYRSVQPAYSSQQRAHCGFTFPMNRRSQDKFVCLWCGYEANADDRYGPSGHTYAASNLAKRFGDEELNSLSFRDVETLLALRFMRRLPDARSASAGLDTRVNEVVNPSPRSISPVKTLVI